jgi:hypothetical protein
LELFGGFQHRQSLIRAEDMVPLKRQNPRLMMLTNDNLETICNQFGN